MLDKLIPKENTEDAVVFFDFENIVYSLRQLMGENPNFEILMEKCQEYGRVVLARAYADWSRHNTVIPALQASGFDPVYVPTYFYDNQERRTRKNAVDIHIAIEAVEVMFTQPQISVYILLTGDKDFIPLANALRRYGKTVVAIGVKGTTSAYMRQATDDFLFYHQLFEEPNGRRRESAKKDIYAVLVDAVTKLKEDGQKSVFPQVKHTMSEMLGSFDETNFKDSKGLPFTRFKDFIVEAQRLGYVKLVTAGSVNEVLLPEDIVITPETQTPPQTAEVEIATAQEPDPHPSGPITDIESAFELLVWAVNHAQAAGKSSRISSIKTIMSRAVDGFDEKQLPDGNFKKFSDFTRAAAKRGLVRIEGNGTRMEILPVGELAVKEVSPTLPPVKPPEGFQPIPAISNSGAEALVPVPATPSSGLAPVPPIPAATYVSDYRLRALVVDALRNCPYPAQPHEIGQHCLALSKRRNIDLPNRRLNQLLTTARSMGLLKPVPDQAGQPTRYSFDANPRLINLFIESETG